MQRLFQSFLDNKQITDSKIKFSLQELNNVYKNTSKEKFINFMSYMLTMIKQNKLDYDESDFFIELYDMKTDLYYNVYCFDRYRELDDMRPHKKQFYGSME